MGTVMKNIFENLFAIFLTVFVQHDVFEIKHKINFKHFLDLKNFLNLFYFSNFQTYKNYFSNLFLDPNNFFEMYFYLKKF